ncbi:aldolase/citrate lyase family protein [bacterium]|nr:aldolase/citrate lyase family protein [bacterium]
MIKNGLNTLWENNQSALNAWLSIGNSLTAEIIAEQGYDSVTVDMQHGIIDYAAAVTMLQAIRASGVTPIVRVPWLDPAAIMQALDAGAYGVICPMVNTRQQAEQLVSYMRYPPRGTRSFGPTRALFSAGSNYAAEVNEEVTCLAMIETAEAMSNLEDIASTPGLDGLYIGPSDLTISVTDGRLPPGFDRKEEEMLETIATIRKAAKSAGIRACLHCGSSDYAANAVAEGFDLVTLLNDVRLLAGAAADSVSQARALIEKG